MSFIAHLRGAVGAQHDRHASTCVEGDGPRRALVEAIGELTQGFGHLLRELHAVADLLPPHSNGRQARATYFAEEGGRHEGGLADDARGMARGQHVVLQNVVDLGCKDLDTLKFGSYRDIAARDHA